MARLPYVDPQAAPEPVRNLLERLPGNLNIFRMLANADTLFRPFLRLGSAILNTMQLDAKARELVILHVARLSRAEYEWTQHVPIAEASGATGVQIEALERGDTGADCFTEQERRILAFTTELVRDVQVSDATFHGLTPHLSAREIVELILTVGYYMTIARIAETTGIELDAPVGTMVLASARANRE